MPVYRKLDSSDIFSFNLSANPRSVFASGSSGWRGSTGPSGSISLYGGLRSRETATGDELTIQPIVEIDTFTIDGKTSISSSYPHTASVSYVQVVDRDVDRQTEEHASFWGDGHFSAIRNLYNYYGRIGDVYSTGSLRYYALYSEASSSNRVTTTLNSLDGKSEYAFEAMIKPLSVTGSDHTILSRGNTLSFFIDSSAKLAVSASDGSQIIHTSSLSVEAGKWSHVAYVTDGSSGSFFIDMVEVGRHAVTGALDSEASDSMFVFHDQTKASASFHGLMFDFRVWRSTRSFSQLSSSFDRTLVNSGSLTDLVHYFRFNDGPLSTEHGLSAGSGALNSSVTFGAFPGTLDDFDTRKAPIWHPNDNPNFIVKQGELFGDPSELRVVHIPSLFYGRQIATGSVKLVCNTYLSSSLQRVLVDDGLGGLYLSGSVTSASLDSREEYRGVDWNRVGNVFYSEGLIVIKDPALLDFGSLNAASPMQDDLLQVSFAGHQPIPSGIYMCRVNGAEANASSNPTYATMSLRTGKKEIVRPKPVTYISAVGLYNEDRELVAVAKLASPVRNREKDRLNIRLRLDF